MGHRCIWFDKNFTVLKGIKPYAWPTKRNCSRFIKGKQFCCDVPDFSTRALPPPCALVSPEIFQQLRSDEILIVQKPSKRQEALLWAKFSVRNNSESNFAIQTIQCTADGVFLVCLNCLKFFQVVWSVGKGNWRVGWRTRWRCCRWWSMCLRC